MRISIGAVIILLAMGVWGSTIWKSERQPASFTREIASVTVEPIGSSESAKEVQRETFFFKRKVDAKLNQKLNPKRAQQPTTKNFADLQYEGTFSLDWLNGKSRFPRRAAVSFEIRAQGKTIQSSVPFVVEFLKDWVIHRLDAASPRSEDEEDMIQVLKDFLSIYAFRTQEDTSGKFEARFTEKGNQITYEKTRYELASLAQLMILDSKHEVTLSKGELVSMKGIEHTQIAPASHGHALSITTESSYLLVRQKISKEKAPKIDATQLVQTSIQLESHRPAFDAPRWQVMQTALNQIQSMGKSERLALFHDLLKTLKKDPARLKDFKDWVMSMKDQPGVLNFGIGVLATLGTEESQKVLVDWFKGIPESRHPILGALSTSEAKLSEDAKALVAEMVDQKATTPDLAYNAAFAMGSEIRKDGAGGVNSAEQKLKQLYQSATQISEQLIYLDAMGNSGSSAFASIVQSNLSSNDETIREKSVYAARFMKPEVAQGLIMKGLQDSSAKVRLSAVKAVAYQNDPSVYRSLLERYAQDTNGVGAASKQVLSGMNQE